MTIVIFMDKEFSENQMRFTVVFLQCKNLNIVGGCICNR